MMSNGEILLMGVGIAGGVFKVGVCLAPIATFKRILKKKTTERFSAMPYGIALFNCLIYVLYSTPFVTDGWHNVVVLLVNAIGVCINAVYVFIFLHYAPPSSKRAMQWLLAGVVTVFGTVLAISVLAVQERKHRALLVGVSAIIATIGLSASPLSVLKLVLKTKSVEFLPIWLSVFTTLCSAFWVAYGVLSKDLIAIMLPNLLGICLGFPQILLYLCFRNNNVVNHVGKLKDMEIDMKKQNNTNGKCSPDDDDDADEHDGRNDDKAIQIMDDDADEHDGRNDDKAIQIMVSAQDHHHQQKPMHQKNLICGSEE